MSSLNSGRSSELMVASGKQVCVASADRKVSVAVELNSLVDSSVGCQWR